MLKVASLISGGGTTMAELGKACFSGKVRAELACVIASNPLAGGLKKARELGVPTENVVVVNPDNFRDRETRKINQDAFGAALVAELQKRSIAVVLQNGWLPLTPQNVIDEFRGRIFNQHPGPVPEFGGKGMFGRRVHAAVLLFRRLTKGPQTTEVIAQRVAPKFDEGEVLFAASVPIHSDDTVDDLQQRALPVEHQTQINLLTALAEGRELTPIHREPIVKEHEKSIWEQARLTAKLLYPNG